MPGTLGRSYREVTSDLKPGTPLFISDHKPLPADGPWNTPHIIDLGEYNQIPNTYQNNVMLWDAVASTVFHSAPWFSSRSLPEVLNPSNDIKAVQFVKDRDDGTKLIIARCSNAVMIGHCKLYTARKSKFYEWKYIFRCEIVDDGTWRIKWAASQQYTRGCLRNALEAKFVRYSNDVPSNIVKTFWQPGAHLKPRGQIFRDYIKDYKGKMDLARDHVKDILDWAGELSDVLYTTADSESDFSLW